MKLEQVAHEFPSAPRNDDAVRLGNTLQAGSKVRRLAYDACS